MAKKFVREQELYELVKSVIGRNTNFDMLYERVAPKCVKCNKSSKEWRENKVEFCPYCGEVLEYEKRASVVATGENCIKNNCFNYYDVDGKGMRNCRVLNIKHIHFEDDDYFIIKA